MINTTNDPSTPPTQRSIGELVQSIRDELLGVVHHEIDIAKKEVTALAVKAGIIAACAAVLLVLLLSAWVMLLFAAATGLQALGLQYWGAFLIVAGVFVVIGAILGLVAFLVSKKLKAPETTIETAQSAVQAVQGKRSQNAVSYDDTFEELYGKQVSARTDGRGAPGWAPRAVCHSAGQYPGHVTLHLHDTATRTHAPFTPVQPGAVSLYVCGPTTQGDPHLGHLRTFLAFDVLVRWLERSGYEVAHVRNVTDIDDKILVKSAEADAAWWAWSRRFEREF